MQPEIVGHLFVVAMALLGVWIVIHKPWNIKSSMNGRCERCYWHLYTQILAARGPHELLQAQKDIEVFWQEFGGKALNAERYKDQLKMLLNKVFYA